MAKSERIEPSVQHAGPHTAVELIVEWQTVAGIAWGTIRSSLFAIRYSPATLTPFGGF